MRRVLLGEHQAIQPVIVLVEVVAAMRRRTGSADVARRIAEELRSFPLLQFVELDTLRADRALEVALATGLRGMDAIVVQTAHEFGAVLTSIDNEMLQLAASLVRTRPVDAF